MAVFTQTTARDLAPWLMENYGLGLAGEPEPITEGIENTNYVIHGQGGTKHIFTVFEVWDAKIASYCLSLASHLNAAGLPVPRTLANIRDNKTCSQYAGKPAAVVEFVEGEARRTPSPGDCEAIGKHMAMMHDGVGGFRENCPNQRGFSWRRETLPKVKDALTNEEARLLDEAFAADCRLEEADLAYGACHCDLFRNNVLWSGDEIAGIIDFYFAGEDRFIFDLSVVAVDWSMDDEGNLDRDNLSSLLQGYLGQRQPGEKELGMFPDGMAAAALRFWLSRLDDIQNPRASHELVAHDPSAFRHRLASCMENRDLIRKLATTFQSGNK